MLKWQIGDVTITQVVEHTTASLGEYLLPKATRELMQSIDWMAPFIDARGRLVLSIHALVIEAGEQTIVVDTCVGNDKERSYPKWNLMQGDFMERFAAAGFATEQVNTVLCTHMHVDHVGWNTRKVDDRWVPTFARADYLFAEDEWAYWQAEEQDFGPVVEDSVTPIFEAGLARIVGQEHRVSESVYFEPTPGHTPGHISIRIASRGEHAVITGDMIHHPCQMKFPEWSTQADFDQAQACETRMHFLDRYADEPVLVLGTHFAGPAGGRVVRDGDVFRLDY